MFCEKYADELLLIPRNVPSYGNCMLHTIHKSNQSNVSTGNAWIYQKLYGYEVHMDFLYY